MKKRLLIVIISLFFCVTFVYAAGSPKREMSLNDVTTKNFISKLGFLPTSLIETVCSYDYCSYFDGENVNRGLALFTEEYLSRIDSEEIRAELRIKGIKITKIVIFQ